MPLKPFVHGRFERFHERLRGFNRNLLLLENLLGEHGEIDTPVAPDMTTIGLNILILVTLAIPVVTQVDCALIQEISLTHTHPVELWLATEQLSTLLCEGFTILNLLGKRSLVCTILQVQTC